MTPTTPSPISEQAAGEPIAKPNYVALARDAGLQLRIDSKFGNPNYQSVSGSWPALVKFAESLSTAPTTGSAPVATLHDDGYYTFHGEKPHGFNYQGWRMDVYAAPASPEASVLTDVQILEAFEASGVQWQSVRTLANDHEYMTYGSQPAKNIIAGVRALLAASTSGERT